MYKWTSSCRLKDIPSWKKDLLLLFRKCTSSLASSTYFHPCSGKGNRTWTWWDSLGLSLRPQRQWWVGRGRTAAPPGNHSIPLSWRPQDERRETDRLVAQVKTGAVHVTQLGSTNDSQRWHWRAEDGSGGNRVYVLSSGLQGSSRSKNKMVGVGARWWTNHQARLPAPPSWWHWHFPKKETIYVKHTSTISSDSPCVPKSNTGLAHCRCPSQNVTVAANRLVTAFIFTLIRELGEDWTLRGRSRCGQDPREA
jgi:hypothetical protein